MNSPTAGRSFPGNAISRRAMLASTLALPARASRRPNVLVFMTDQESAVRPGPAHTPHRQRLEQSGVSFANAFCNTPQCSATRSALLTGLEPHRTGVLTNVDASSLGRALPENLPTVGSVFREAGYHTAYFGKWHLGNDSDGLQRYGFAEYVRGSDETVTRAAANWIRSRREPWVAWVSILNPHDIYEIPKRLKTVQIRPGVRPTASGLDNLRDKPSEQRWFSERDQGRQTLNFTPEDWLRYRSFYCELLEKADTCFGTVMESLSDADGTIIAYTSDHGDALGEHGLPYKGPFMYEELIRVPLIIRAPGEFASVKRRNDMVTSADLAPTLASLARLSWPGQLSGTPLTGSALTRDAVFLEYYAKQKAVNPIRTIRTRRWKLNCYDRGNRELYDLQQDPHELKNLAGEKGGQRVAAQLKERLDAWRAPMVASQPSSESSIGR